MNEIICPHCNKVFKVDEAGFASILKQVRDHKFDEELQARLLLADIEKETAVKLAEANLRNILNEEIAKKDKELSALNSKKEIELAKLISDKESELAQLQSKILNAEVEKKLAINEAVQQIEKERDSLANNIKIKDTEKELSEKSLIEKFNAIIISKNEEIALRKDMKLKLSTKMLGETLEQHCANEFDKIRATAFQKSYFEKDKNSESGSKGDFVFKEFDEAGNEIISIMFEMKNEGDDTLKKHKNEEFFVKLDKDRNEKKCEYAVLVTLLEADNDLYNSGIVDVSHKFSKMYVVRPQFFIPIITLLRNAAMNSMQYKSELALIRNKNIDITGFEDALNNFKDDFTKKGISAKTNFEAAILAIDKSIAKMQEVKDALRKSENQFLSANKLLDGLTIKKLTRNNPTMKEKFDELNKNK
jgi:hypothetical protein